jgi:hypothetical protein
LSALSAEAGTGFVDCQHPQAGLGLFRRGAGQTGRAVADDEHIGLDDLSEGS